MEFPDLGEHCQFPGCNQIDFLPIQCQCGQVFCRSHFNEHCLSGKCDKAPKAKEVNLENTDTIYKCSQVGCRKGNLHEMLCPKCGKHYCIEHRFHASCPEIDEATLAAKIEEFEAPRRQFNEANKHLQEKITENIRKALQSSAKVKTAAKIHLMRIKQKAIGPKTIPVADRVYFAIVKPANMDAKPIKVINTIENIDYIESVTLEPDLKDVVAVFISHEWSLGKAIDSICQTCKVKNENNRPSDVKLRLFRQLDGYCISHSKMDVVISDLMKQEILLEGDRLRIEYISGDVLSNLDENAHVFLQ